VAVHGGQPILSDEDLEFLAAVVKNHPD